MNKRQLIDDIRKYNVTAQPTFLNQFDAESLKQYLQHLENAGRRNQTIAVVARKTNRLRMVG